MARMTLMKNWTIKFTYIRRYNHSLLTVLMWLKISKKVKVGGLFYQVAYKRLEKFKKVLLKKPSKKFIAVWYGCNYGYETTLPIPLGLSCTWDMN
jgi:hypothetical protein